MMLAASLKVTGRFVCVWRWWWLGGVSLIIMNAYYRLILRNLELYLRGVTLLSQSSMPMHMKLLARLSIGVWKDLGFLMEKILMKEMASSNTVDLLSDDLSHYSSKESRIGTWDLVHAMCDLSSISLFMCGEIQQCCQAMHISWEG